MAAPDEPPTFTLRYQLTAADARGAFWFAAREWLPVLVGLGLLTLLCATWPLLGHNRRAAAIGVPALTALTILWYRNRATRSVEPYLDRAFVLTFDRDELSLDSGLARSTLPWTSVRRIVRGRSYWFFSTRSGGRFFVPAAAVPVEARAFVARWASEAGARLS